MSSKVKKDMWLFFKLCVLAYFILVAALYFAQRSFVYFSNHDVPATPDDVVNVVVKTKDDITIKSWYVPRTDHSKPVIVYFHGNAGNFSHRSPKVMDYVKEGFGVLLAEYRGYGGNEGKISESGLYMDARAQIDWLLTEQGLTEDDIVIYGESIGSGPATQMATEYSVKALVLETPFSSLVDVAGSIYWFVPVRYLLKDRYMNIDKIAAIKAPLLIVHGTNDEVINIRFARNLYKSAVQPKTMVEIPDGDHNGLFYLGLTTHVLDFLSGINVNDADNKESE